MPERKNKNYSGRLLPALLLLLLAAASCRTVPPATAPVEFILLQINDVYEITPLEGGKAGGLARVATIRQYEIVIPKFIMDGKEVNLEFLADYSYENPATLEVNGEAVKNDIRNIVISYLAGQ